MRVALQTRMTAVEFLAWEREQPDKHEYFQGEVFAMSGGSPRHNVLSLRVGAALQAALRGRCTVASSDQRVALSTEHFAYPDLTVVCGRFELQPGTTDTVVNPSMVVEILSASTESYNRGDKWAAYQQIASLTDYVLVSQATARVEHYARSGDRWSYRAYGAGEQLPLSNGATVAIDELYEGAFDIPGE